MLGRTALLRCGIAPLVHEEDRVDSGFYRLSGAGTVVAGCFTSKRG
jgi:hypothetical protein